MVHARSASVIQIGKFESVFLYSYLSLGSTSSTQPLSTLVEHIPRTNPDSAPGRDVLRPTSKQRKVGEGNNWSRATIGRRATSIPVEVWEFPRRVATRPPAVANFHGNFRKLTLTRARKFPAEFLEIWTNLGQGQGGRPIKFSVIRSQTAVRLGGGDCEEDCRARWSCSIGPQRDRPTVPRSYLYGGAVWP